mmetsp:Transcript_25466/g.87839  ORF Transcript_25466/g.87839 Transcript_25466/m.87839 type:complete len:231 (+) Transcript_25466:1573-2265(+)
MYFPPASARTSRARWRRAPALTVPFAAPSSEASCAGAGASRRTSAESPRRRRAASFFLVLLVVHRPLAHRPARHVEERGALGALLLQRADRQLAVEDALAERADRVRCALLAVEIVLVRRSVVCGAHLHVECFAAPRRHEHARSIDASPLGLLLLGRLAGRLCWRRFVRGKDRLHHVALTSYGSGLDCRRRRVAPPLRQRSGERRRHVLASVATGAATHSHRERPRVAVQ